MGNDMTTPELPPLPDHPDDCIADAWSAHEEHAIRAYAESARAPLVAEVEKLRAALLQCSRMAEALKRPCGEDPESAQAIRNSQYANIATCAHIALGTISGPSMAATHEVKP